MRKRRDKAATFRTQAGAERYRRDLALAWPTLANQFRVGLTTNDFRWAVFAGGATVLKCRRRDMNKLGYRP